MARRNPPTVHGLCVVDKPAGVTSHDVVGMLRRRFGERRVGHAGTLDPDATGVLLVGVGSVTKLMRFMSAMAKAYTAEVVLGTSTSTLDASGEVTGRWDMSAVTLAEARLAVADHLVGAIEQIPPMVSAVRIDGRRLHELARAGIEVDRPPRSITVHAFDLEATAEPHVLAARVQCSSGTYVRTLADDLGRLLGGGAHLRNLRRTAVGSFTVDEAQPPDECVLLPPWMAMRDHQLVVVDEAVAAVVVHGRVLPRFEGDPPWGVMNAAGDLLAVYEEFGVGEAKPAVVL
jgi:tRNA pseudouridine55 synthase